MSRWPGTVLAYWAQCSMWRSQARPLASAFALVRGQGAIRANAVVAHAADREAIHLGGILPSQQLMEQRFKALRFGRRQYIQKRRDGRNPRSHQIVAGCGALRRQVQGNLAAVLSG